MRRFFIVGCPRSGTTLLQQILGRHPEVVIPPETAFFTKLVSESGALRPRPRRQIESDLGVALEVGERLADNAAVEALYRQMAEAYVGATDANAPAWFGDKTPDHLRHTDRIARLLPDARFVLIHRDGRDVALSLSKVPWSPSDPVVNFGIWRQAVAHQRRLLADPPAPVLTVRYEDLASSPRDQVRRLTDFLEIDYDDSLLVPREDADGIPEWEMDWKARAVEPIRQDRIAVWRRELDPRAVRTMERWGGVDLTELGYELSEPDAGSATWAELLPIHLRWAGWRARAALRLLLGRP